jgi:hypothetical protein
MSITLLYCCEIGRYISRLQVIEVWTHVFYALLVSVFFLLSSLILALLGDCEQSIGLSETSFCAIRTEDKHLNTYCSIILLQNQDFKCFNEGSRAMPRLMKTLHERPGRVSKKINFINNCTYLQIYSERESEFPTSRVLANVNDAQSGPAYSTNYGGRPIYVLVISKHILFTKPNDV